MPTGKQGVISRLFAITKWKLWQNEGEGNDATRLVYCSSFPVNTGLQTTEPCIKLEVIPSIINRQVSLVVGGVSGPLVLLSSYVCWENTNLCIDTALNVKGFKGRCFKNYYPLHIGSNYADKGLVIRQFLTLHVYIIYTDEIFARIWKVEHTEDILKIVSVPQTKCVLQTSFGVLFIK